MDICIAYPVTYPHVVSMVAKEISKNKEMFDRKKQKLQTTDYAEPPATKSIKKN